MREIELSIMEHSAAVLQPVLDRFEERERIRVHLQTLSWGDRAEMQRFALYNRGPDMSEIGTTWVADFVAMNALRPFSPRESESIFKAADVLPAALETCVSEGDGKSPRSFAIPLLGESHLIYYRKDMLRRAGLDDQKAFTSHAALNQAAAQLLKARADIPVVPVYLYEKYITLHSLASWIWEAGGQFCRPDGSQVLFDQPEALAGLCAFYQFGRSLSPAGRQQVLADAGPRLFYDGHAAMAIGTLDFRGVLWNQLSEAERLNWGATRLPGAHFVGGSNLVIWNHSRHVEEALALARYLADPQVLLQYALGWNRLPVTWPALQDPRITGDPILCVMADALATGRTYQPVPLWGLVEERYITAVMQIGRQLVEDPGLDLEAHVRKQVEPVARRLNITLRH